jgi:hypothetical protein
VELWRLVQLQLELMALAWLIQQREVLEQVWIPPALQQQAWLLVGLSQQAWILLAALQRELLLALDPSWEVSNSTSRLAEVWSYSL